jgi:chromosome partitioning protein
MVSGVDFSPLKAATELLSGIQQPYGAIIEFAVLAVVVIYVVAQIVNPIVDFIRRVWDVVTWAADNIGRWIKRLIKRPPPAPDPKEPIRVIPQERTVWEIRAPAQPIFPEANGPPIIAVANMKGGVGKTTIVANLAAYFKQRRNKPILLIDFDYQGSLSQTMLAEAGSSDPELTSDILIGPIAGDDPSAFARPLKRGLEDVYLYAANYPLATIENNLLASWLSNADGDLMYRLCSLLRGAVFQQKYGVILIDCPPRLTPGSINALCASTHLLVPTSLDELSAQAAEYFLDQVSRMRGTVFPALNVIGIVPSIIYSDRSLLAGEERAHDRLSRYGASVWRRNDFVLFEGRVPRKADISNAAGASVPYLHRASVRQIFDRLGAEIDKRL